MTEPVHPAEAERFARSLMLQAAWPAVAISVVLLAIPFALARASPFFASVAGSAAMACGLAGLALCALLLFDAVLFRLIASHETAPGGCKAVDALLARMRLKPAAAETRTLGERIAGTRGLLRYQRTALAGFAVAVVAMILSALS